MNFNIKTAVALVAALIAAAGVPALPDDFYDDFLSEAQREYDDFRNQMNHEYAEFLKNPWEPKKLLPPIPKKKEPPVPIKEVIDDDRNHEDNELGIITVIPDDRPVTRPQPKPISTVPEVDIPKSDNRTLTVFGTPFSFSVDQNMEFAFNPQNENQISSCWSYLSTQDGMTAILNSLLKYRSDYNLCDWAYFKLIDKLSASLCTATNGAKLLTGWLLSQSGYSARLAFTESNNVEPLLGCDDIIFGTPFIMDGSKRYYSFAGGQHSYRVVPKDFPGASSFSMEMYSQPKLAFKSGGKRKITVKNHPEITIETESNANMMELYSTMPRAASAGNEYTQWNMYASTPISERNQQAIYPALRSAIDGKSEWDAANLIIKFCQTFEYKLDDEMWGDDRAFFPDETLHYFYSDCEDHAILFVRIIKDLLGLKTALIYYPGHLAAAVAFNEDVTGDYIMSGGRKWTVCDPTYFYVNVGRQMPNVDSSNAILIPLP